jgi:hypothetical protein
MVVFEKIDDWIRADATGKDILWLHGPAGAGKSAIAQSVAEKCAEKCQLAASFFFFRGDPSRNALGSLFATLAVQIAFVKNKQALLDRILIQNPDLVHRVDGFLDLIVALCEIRDSLPDGGSDHKSEPPPPSIVIIDGLDECSSEEGQQSIILDVLRLAVRALYVVLIN